jgi:hypothetical protein
MRLVYFAPGRCRQTLHAVVTPTEQKGAQHVDEDVQPGVQEFYAIAIPFEQNARAFCSGAPYRDDQVDQEDDYRPRAEV